MEKKTNFKKAFSTRVFRNGGYSLLMVIAVVVVAVLVNILIASLPSSIVKPSISPYDYYTVTDTTIDLVKGITDDITIHLVVTPGAEDEVVEEFVKRYCEMNSHLSLKYVDPSASPAFVEEYAPDGLDENSLVVINERTGTARLVAYTEIFYLDFASQEEYMQYLMYGVGGTIYFGGENALTSALDFVTMESHPKIYFTSGHGETALGTTLLSYIEDDNYLTDTLSLLTVTAVPADASVVLINLPTKDFTEAEITILRNFMSAGGKVILNSYYQNGDLPLLYGLMKEYGLGYKHGMVVEGNVNHYYQAPYFLMPTLTASAIADKMTSTNIHVFMPLAHAIDNSIEVDTTKYTKTVLMQTSSVAFIKIPPEEGGDMKLTKEEGDEEGTFTLSCMVTNTAGGGVIWFGSPFFMDDQFISYNVEYVMATLGHLTGKESSISIATKPLTDTALTVSAGAQSFWAVALIGVIPLGCLGYGLYVWNKRRKQ